MRRVSSTQSRIITLGSEQCMQRPPVRSNSASRATPNLHRLHRWLLLLFASLLGFAFLIALWIWLPPSTVLGVTAQAQQAQQSSHARARDISGSALLRNPNLLHSHSDTAAGSPVSGSGTRSVAAGSSLVKQAQEQLQQQKQQRQHQQQQQQQHHAGRSTFRGSSSSTSTSSSSMSSTAAATQQQQQQQSGTGTASPVPPSAQVVVVGGGLAGLVAALQAAECLAEVEAASSNGAASAAHSNGSSCLPALCHGSSSPASAAAADAAAATGASPPRYAVEVLLVEKMPKLGGNSAKASSGINALNPGAGDSEPLFRDDVETSGGGASKPELVSELVRSSQAALTFLETHGAALTGVTRLGGHSVPRTRTVSGGANVGWVLMSSLMEAVRKQPRIRVLEGYALRRILTDGAGSGGDKAAGGVITGVELAAAGGPDGAVPEPGPLTRMSCAALVLATGGFAANKELIQSVSPAAADLATTNGPWARGESLALASAAGAALVGLEDVQVHPTGFVDPADPGAGTKFLAPEKLRGVGGLLLNGQGSRFVDELARRDVVAAALMALPGRTAWLLLGRDAGAEYGTGALEFYCKKGLMRKADSLAQAAEAMGVAEAPLRAQLQDYVAAAAKAAGGGADAADPYGKRVFPHPADPEQQLPMYIAKVTPVVHYTMGGVAINERAEVLKAAAPGGAPDASGGVVKGLYAAGEVSGGLHGHNRLGGNSLLECAVFGRIAGSQAAACSARR